MHALLLLLPLLAGAADKPAASPKTNTMARPAAKVTAQPKLAATPMPKADVDASQKLHQISPLPRAKLLEAAKQVTKTAPVIDEPRRVTITPREPVRAGAFMNVVGGNVWVAPAGDLEAQPRAVVGAAASADAFDRYVEVSFPTRAGYAYMLDCQVTGSRMEVLRNFQTSTRTSHRTTDGHLLVALGTQTVSARATYQIASHGSFALSSCEVVPVK